MSVLVTIRVEERGHVPVHGADRLHAGQRSSKLSSEVLGNLSVFRGGRIESGTYCLEKYDPCCLDGAVLLLGGWRAEHGDQLVQQVGGGGDGHPLPCVDTAVCNIT